MPPIDLPAPSRTDALRADRQRPYIALSVEAPRQCPYVILSAEVPRGRCIVPAGDPVHEGPPHDGEPPSLRWLFSGGRTGASTSTSSEAMIVSVVEPWSNSVGRLIIEDVTHNHQAAATLLPAEVYNPKSTEGMTPKQHRDNNTLVPKPMKRI